MLFKAWWKPVLLLGLLVVAIDGHAPLSAVSIVRQLPPELSSAVHQVLRGERVLRAPEQAKFDNVCADTINLEYIPPFLCVFQLPVVAVQFSPEYSLSWILSHTDPTLLLGIVCLGESDLFTMPRSIGQFTNLLGIRFDFVKAPFPSSEIANLVNLEAFEIMRVEGTLEVPPFHLLHRLRTIVVSHVSGGMTGELQSLGKLEQLDYLSFAGSDFGGLHPSDWKNLESVSVLDVRQTRLNCPLPNEFPPRVSTLLVVGTGLNGTIPSELAKLSNLANLELSSNDLSGPIPTLIGLLTKLTSFCLQDNRLQGTIPTQLGVLTGLQELRLGKNNLTGTLPSQLGNLVHLTALDVGDNLLHGTLPLQLARLSRVTFLDLGNNTLEGDPTFLCSPLTSLEELRTANNNFHGSISACASVWKQDCDLSGLGSPCQREWVACRGWEYEFTDGDPKSGRLGECKGPETYLGIPAGILWVFFFGVLFHNLRGEGNAPGDPSSVRKYTLAVCWATVATLEAISAYTTVLVLIRAPKTLGLLALAVVIALLHGVVVSAWCPATEALNAFDFFFVTLSPLSLAELPWRAVLKRDGRERRRGESGGQVVADDAPPQPDQGVQPDHETADLVKFALRTSRLRVATCLMLVVCQAVMVDSLGTNLAWLALATGACTLCVALCVLFAAHQRARAVLPSPHRGRVAAA